MGMISFDVVAPRPSPFGRVLAYEGNGLAVMKKARSTRKEKYAVEQTSTLRCSAERERNA